jgi:hypothetical protein
MHAGLIVLVPPAQREMAAGAYTLQRRSQRQRSHGAMLRLDTAPAGLGTNASPSSQIRPGNPAGAQRLPGPDPELWCVMFDAIVESMSTIIDVAPDARSTLAEPHRAEQLRATLMRCIGDLRQLRAREVPESAPQPGASTIESTADPVR